MKILEVSYLYDEALARARGRPVDAEGARRRLDEGSRSLASLLKDAADGDGIARRVIPVDPRDLGSGAEGGAPVQRPYAAVVGCSDARVPIELIFNEGPNDLFVVRVAGNGLGAEGLGSLKNAVDKLGESLKLVVVLGHSGCGAVSAAVDIMLQPHSYLALQPSTPCATFSIACSSSCMRARSDWPSCTAPTSSATHAIGRRSSSRGGVERRACRVHGRPGILRDKRRRRARRVRRVAARIAPDLGTACGRDPEYAGLAFPPADAEEFDAFADAVARSPRIVAMLT